MEPRCYFIGFLAERSIVQQLPLGQEIQGGGHLLQIEALRPPRIPGSFAFSKFGLDVHQQIDALGLNLLCLFPGRGQFLFPNDDRENIALGVSVLQGAEAGKLLLPWPTETGLFSVLVLIPGLLHQF